MFVQPQDPEVKRLEKEATRILHKAGCTWSGRSKESVSHEQKDFESKRFTSVPCGGQHRK